MYRTRASTQTDAARGPAHLLRLDVSGRRGVDGERGSDGADGHHGGGSGGHGRHAGPARPGEDAGRIRVELRAAGREVRVVGSTSFASQHEPIDTAIDLGRPGDLVLLARGGDGGHGGHGGGGGSGGSGRAGADATRYSSGSDGGRGGDGGDGGDGTSGAPGGAGGAVEVVVSEDDTHLVLVVSEAVGGGGGGAAGRNGGGGGGGAGGEGGSSYSWTETEEYTDGQGNRQTRTHHRSNHGGSRGASGISGTAGRAHLHAGRPGAPGSFAIEVRTAKGDRHRYPRRFDLSLSALRHRPDDADGIYEPGEPVTVSEVVVQNAGGMPTPPNHPTVITLRRSSWVLPVEGDRLVLGDSLDVDHAVTLDGRLRFTIASFVPQAPGEALASEEVLHLDAVLPAANRAFSDFEASRGAAMATFPIRFPVEMAPADGLHALAPGEATRLAVSITNVSKRAMGRTSDRRRRVVCRLRLDRSELGDEHAWAFDDRGRRVSLEAGLEVEIDLLDPGASATVAVSIAMAPGAPPYRGARVLASLELGRPTAPDVLSVAQLRMHEVRVASRFAPSEDADLLLVVGARTTRAALDAWIGACRELGLTPATWDVSLEGHLDMADPIPGGGNLLERFAGCAVVILDGTIPAPDGGETRPSRLLSRAHAHALHAAGARVVFVGGDGDPRAWLLRDGEGEGDTEAGDASSDRLVKDALGLSVGAASAPRTPTTLRFWGGTPDTHDLEAVAMEIADDFARAAPPRHRALFAWSYAERVVSETLWIRRFSLGTLRALRLPDRGRGRFVHAAASDDELVDPAWIAARGVALVASALSAEAKTRRLLAAGTGDAPWPASSAVEDDVAVEIAAEYAAAVLRGGSVEDDELPVLSAVARAAGEGAGALDAASAGGAALARLAGLVRTLARGHVRWWEWLPPFVLLGRRPRLRRLARAQARALLDAAFGIEGAARDAADVAAVEAQRELLGAHAREKRSAFFKEGLGGYVVESALRRHEALGMRADESSLPTGVLTLSAHELGVLGAADARGSANRDATRSALADARASLLIPGGAAALDAAGRTRAPEVEAEGDVADAARLLERGPTVAR